MKLFFFLIFFTLNSFAASNKDFTNNSSLGINCHSFLKKKKPEEFKINISLEEIGDKKFSKDRIEIIINKPIDDVWAHYKKLNLKNILQTSESEVCGIFGVDKNDKNYFLEEKQLVFINILLQPLLPISPMIKSMAALKINKIDNNKKIIQIIYLEGTLSKGWEEFIFINHKGKTKVIQNAYYLGNNRLIDELYPNIHKSIWNKIHKKIKQLIEKQV